MAKHQVAAAAAEKVTRRGRPSVSRATSIDAQIRAAALALFLEQGFDAVTMEMIAQRTGVSKPTLYTRHDSKVDLLRVVVHEEVARWLGRTRSMREDLPADLKGRLRAHGLNIIASQSWTDLRRISRLINDVAAKHPEIVTATYEAGLHPVISYLASDLRDAATSSGLATADWEFLAEMFFHAIFGWQNAASILGEIRDDEALAYVEKIVGAVLTVASAAASESTDKHGPGPRPKSR